MTQKEVSALQLQVMKVKTRNKAVKTRSNQAKKS